MVRNCSGDIGGIPSTTQSTPLLNRSTGTFPAEDAYKAELLSDVYVNKNTSLNPIFPFGPTTMQTTLSIDCFTPVEVASVVKSLPKKSSAGPDGIS